MNRLFGIGFGYYYGAVFNAILVNTGWIGLVIYFMPFSSRSFSYAQTRKVLVSR